MVWGMKSFAGTAWELCEDVIEIMRQEPRRVDMGYYMLIGSNYGGDYQRWPRWPACGMVGCFAGWVVQLRYPDNSRPHHRNTARAILGLGLKYDIMHSPGRPNSVFNSGFGDACIETRSRTPAHAAAVIKRIRRFMRINEKGLKARRLPAYVNQFPTVGAVPRW
jgi:hypothetical protein